MPANFRGRTFSADRSSANNDFFSANTVDFRVRHRIILRPNFSAMNPPHSPLGPVHRPPHERVDSIIKPTTPVVHRTIDLNPWLLLLVLILSVPTVLWCREQWLKYEAPPAAAVPVVQAPPPADPTPAPAPAPAPPPAAEVVPPVPPPAPVASVPASVPVSPAPPVTSAPPADTTPKPVSRQVPAGSHRITYTIYSNYAGDSLRAKYTDDQGKISFQTINGSWRHEVFLKKGTTVVFGASLSQPGTSATYVRVVILLDGAVWKSDEASGENAEPQVSGVVSD